MKPFNHEELTFLKGLNQRGRATTPEAEKMLKICQRLIGPEYRFCTDCSDIIAGKFRMMMENAEKQINMQIRHYRPPVNTDPSPERKLFINTNIDLDEEIATEGEVFTEEITPKHPRKDLVRMKNVVIKKLVEEAYDNKLPFDTEQRSRKQIIDDAFEMLLQSQTRKEADHA